MSADANSVMSQQDIDAMVASATEIGDQTSGQPQAAQPAADASATQPEPGSSAPHEADASLADVLQRLANLEASVAKLSRAGGTGGQAQPDVQALAQQVHALSRRVQEILEFLPKTLGYGVRASFTCRSCQAQGWVAGLVACTNCGAETWIGWWPQRQQ
jgi:hypothetical protein